jgi:integrase
MKSQALAIQSSADLSEVDGHPALPAVVYLSRLGTEESKSGMKSSLNSIAEILTGVRDWKAVDWRRFLNAALIETVIAQLSGAPATKNKTLAAVKGIARSAFRLGWITGESYTKIKDIGGFRGSRQTTGRDLSKSENAALLDVCRCDKSPAGSRDTALFAVVAITGARRAELAALQVGDLDADDDGMVRARIIGKGNKERLLYIHGKAKEALDAWLALRGSSPGAVFCRIAKGGMIHADHAITPTALAKILKKRAGEAGLQEITLHDFRRTAAGNLLDAGADISTVAGLLGHSSVQTTARYDRRGERARISASRLLTVA